MSSYCEGTKIKRIILGVYSRVYKIVGVKISEGFKVFIRKMKRY